MDFPGVTGVLPIGRQCYNEKRTLMPEKPVERRFTNMWCYPPSNTEIPKEWGCEKKIEELLGRRQVYQKPYRPFPPPIYSCGRVHMFQ